MSEVTRQNPDRRVLAPQLEARAVVLATRRRREKEKDMDSKAKAEKHVIANTVKFDAKEGMTLEEMILSLGRRCVDGRHTKEQAENSFAFAGADVGLVMALSRASAGKIDLITSYKAVSRALKRMGTSFFYHTDTHAQHDEHKHDTHSIFFGCGHALKPTDMELAKRYGIDPKQQALLIALIKSGKRDEDMAELDETVLDGNHLEEGVLVVDSEKFTVEPMSEAGQQYFVYDLRLIRAFMKMVWEELKQDATLDLSGISLDNFIEAEGAQRDVTVDELATKKGKPTFKVIQKNDGLAVA